MQTVKTLMEQAEMLSDLVADAIIKKTAPIKDDMSERQAEKAYGARWLRRMREQGLAIPNYIGNRTVYSRHKLDCLRAAERQHAQMIFDR
jgi:hypothetical protein